MNNEINNKTTDIKCEIIRDLLPLYHDGVVSDVTKDTVDNHLRECKDCNSEYRTLCTELPCDTESKNTSNIKLKTFFKKLKAKKRLFALAVASITCVILFLIGYLIFMVPFIPVKDFESEVVRVYKYEVDGTSKALLLYQLPYYGPSFHNPKVTVDGTEATINLNQKRTIANISSFFGISDEPNSDFYICEIPEDCSSIKLGSKVIWTEERNGDDKVPDYVYAYDDYRSPDDNIRSWSYTDDFNNVTAYYEDERKISWDINGNIIYDSYPDESGQYPE